MSYTLAEAAGPAVAEQRCDTDTSPRHAAGDDAAWRRIAEARLAVVEQRLADLKLLLGDMRAERDAWLDHAQRLTLTALAPQTTWRWLRRRVRWPLSVC